LKPELSVVIPVFNEEENLPELWRRLEKELPSLGATTEVIFVDDRSTDGTLETLFRMAGADPRVKVLALSRNFGHQRALSAGLDRAGGKAVMLMDGDLQDDPAALAQFVETWRQGFEVVYAIREKRKEGFLKRASFALFYRLQTAVSGIAVPMDAGIFSLLDRNVVGQLWPLAAIRQVRDIEPLIRGPLPTHALIEWLRRRSSHHEGPPCSG